MDKNGKIEQQTYDLLNNLKSKFHAHRNSTSELDADTTDLIESFCNSIDHLYSELVDFELELQRAYGESFDSMMELASSAELKLSEAKVKYEKRNQNAGKAIKDKFNYLVLLAKRECESFFSKYPSVLSKKEFRHGDLSYIRKNMQKHFDMQKYEEFTGMNEIPVDKTFENNIKKALKDYWPDFYNSNYKI